MQATLVRGQKMAHHKPGLCTGTIVAINAHGQAFVDYPGNPRDAVAARSALPTPLRREDAEGRDVLLFFENDDPQMPIIVGVINTALSSPAATERATQLHEVKADNHTLVIEAQQELVLRCGKGSITLTQEGKVIIKGTHLTSRSSGMNKVKGASVAIN